MRFFFLSTDTIVNTIDKKKINAVVLLDMSKAFDSVNHETLILKLQDAGTSSRTLQWFRSYHYHYHYHYLIKIQIEQIFKFTQPAYSIANRGGLCNLQ